MTLDINAAFDAGTQGIEQRAASLAEEIAIEDDMLDRLKDECKARGESVERKKLELATILMQAGMDSIKLRSGLSPKVRINRSFFKQAGVTDEQLFAWLNGHDLGGIIKPTVHFQTLQSTLKEFEEQGNVVPDDLFNAVDRPTVTMYGKAKFLGARDAQ